MMPLFACLRTPRLPDAATAVASDFSPRLQRHGRGCVVLDVSGLGRLLGDPDTIGVELARACASRCGNGVPPELADRDWYRVAVAPTRMATLLLSLTDAPLTVITSRVADAIADLPVRLLHQLLAELHDANILRSKRGLAPQAATWERYEHGFEVLQRWGVTTLGELAALPAADLSARLGQEGVVLQQHARGEDHQPLVPDPGVPRFVEHVELEWPIDALEPLSFVLARMLEPLSTALERADRGAAALHLQLRLTDRTSHVRMLQLPAAMRDPKVLRTLLVLDLESHPPPAAIDHLTLEIDPAPGRVIQYSLLERAQPSAETLATLTARLDALVGASRAGRAVLLDSHRPDAFEMQRFSVTDHTRHRASSATSATSASASSGSAKPMLRRFRPPMAVRVTVERGRPHRLAIDRRGMPGGHVEQAAGPWRSSGAWWGTGDAREVLVPWDRDEWDVALSDGSVCRLFRDRVVDRWFMEGLID